MGNWSLVVFFVGLLGAAVMAGVPIAFAFALATSRVSASVTTTPLTIVVGRMDEGMGGLILLAVPLFVLLGQLVDRTGMARVMVGFLAVAARPCPGRHVLRAARARCCWSPASPARRRRTWRLSRRCCSRKCASAA